MCFLVNLMLRRAKAGREKITLKQKAKAKWQSDPASSQHSFSGA
jgi:hypothetical protein